MIKEKHKTGCEVIRNILRWWWNDKKQIRWQRSDRVRVFGSVQTAVNF